MPQVSRRVTTALVALTAFFGSAVMVATAQAHPLACNNSHHKALNLNPRWKLKKRDTCVDKYGQPGGIRMERSFSDGRLWYQEATGYIVKGKHTKLEIGPLFKCGRLFSNKGVPDRKCQKIDV